MTKLYNENGFEIDTSDMGPGEVNTRIALGFATKAQWSAAEKADKERVKAAQSNTPQEAVVSAAAPKVEPTRG